MPVPRTDLDKPDSVPSFTLYSINLSPTPGPNYSNNFMGDTFQIKLELGMLVCECKLSIATILRV